MALSSAGKVCNSRPSLAGVTSTFLELSSHDERDLISLEGRELCDGERVAQLLQKIRVANPGKRLLIVLDNAPYNHCWSGN